MHKLTLKPLYWRRCLQLEFESTGQGK